MSPRYASLCAQRKKVSYEMPRRPPPPAAAAAAREKIRSALWQRWQRLLLFRGATISFLLLFLFLSLPPLLHLPFLPFLHQVIDLRPPYQQASIIFVRLARPRTQARATPTARASRLRRSSAGVQEKKAARCVTLHER